MSYVIFWCSVFIATLILPFALGGCLIKGPMGMALIPVNFGVDVLVPLDAGLEDFE